MAADAQSPAHALLHKLAAAGTPTPPIFGIRGAQVRLISEPSDYFESLLVRAGPRCLSWGRPGACADASPCQQEVCVCGGGGRAGAL